jgi:ubiquitin carboxyl-terminal hydrolase 10
MSQRGHQQDAEEFLGFLLQGLDDECTQAMTGGGGVAAGAGNAAGGGSTLTPGSASGASVDPSGSGGADDWLEVGRKQRPAVTRSSGASSSSPITRIFGGLLRSELRVPRLKDSITTEPFQPLQLDIQAPEVRNIVDALRGITRIETLHGDFGSPLGKDGRATKQVFIESLPPVLILHLKRFQFDAEGTGATVKIWKKVGYPLDLEIPREVFSRQKRNSILLEGGAMPRYRLVAVVYHHGKNASGGHYTVDVRRQDGREWIRLDDTVIRRVRSEDVAAAGAEGPESSSSYASASASSSAAMQSSNSNNGTEQSNRFGGMDDEDAGEDQGWNQVSGGGAGAGGVNGSSTKRWSSVLNGGTSSANAATASSPAAAAKNKQLKEGIKDNKVAYLLFYQRV